MTLSFKSRGNMGLDDVRCLSEVAHERQKAGRGGGRVCDALPRNLSWFIYVFSYRIGSPDNPCMDIPGWIAGTEGIDMKRTSRRPAALIGSAIVIVLSLNTVSAVRAQTTAPGQGQLPRYRRREKTEA
jgi:hypothetical protein